MTDHTADTREALAAIARALDTIGPADRAGLAASARLELVTAARAASGRLEALLAVLVAEADAADASVEAVGTPITTWLTLSGQASQKESAHVVFTGRDLRERPAVRSAALKGSIGVRQGRAIVRALADLPPGVPEECRDLVEQTLLTRAAFTPAHRLATMGPDVLAEVGPQWSPSREDAVALVAARTRRAQARRGLWWFRDGDGSVIIKAALPELAATPLLRLIDAHVESDRRSGRDLRDPVAEGRSPSQRRADALVALIAEHGDGRRGPTLAGDRPRVVVFLNEDSLRQRAEQEGVLASGETIAPGELRRLCCDADITPVVLGTASEILDVGQTHRLATPAIRRALALRDGGCVFPHCEAGEAQCDAHHIEPWWAGGVTSLTNLVLLCPHHHQLVEPPRFWTKAPPDRWQIRLDASGRAVVTPPDRLGESDPGGRSKELLRAIC